MTKKKDNGGDTALMERPADTKQAREEAQEKDRLAAINQQELRRGQLGGTHAEVMRRDPNLQDPDVVRQAYARHREMIERLKKCGEEENFEVELSQFGLRVLVYDKLTGRVHLVAQPHMREIGQVAIVRTVDEVVAELTNDRIHCRTRR